jgi:hypothetical protein
MKSSRLLVGLISAGVWLAGAVAALAHCDTLDGPVVTEAKAALEKGDVTTVLKWVKPGAETEIRSVFEKTMAVRKQGVDAKELADMYFFETLVRVHRAGEGAPYTGLKPAGRDLGPAIPAADKALETGSIERVEKLLVDSVKECLHEHFHHALAKKKYDKKDVDAGRAYVEAYVSYIHCVEGLYEAAKSAAHGHYPEEHDGKSHED